MCPFCLSTTALTLAGMISAGVISAGGIGALLAQELGSKTSVAIKARKTRQRKV